MDESKDRWKKDLVFSWYDLKNQEDNIKARIKNQLRIHWKWVRGQTFDEAYKFFETCINQAVSGNYASDKID